MALSQETFYPRFANVRKFHHSFPLPLPFNGFNQNANSLLINTFWNPLIVSFFWNPTLCLFNTPLPYMKFSWNIDPLPLLLASKEYHSRCFFSKTKTIFVYLFIFLQQTTNSGKFFSVEAFDLLAYLSRLNFAKRPTICDIKHFIYAKN